MLIFDINPIVNVYTEPRLTAQIERFAATLPKHLENIRDVLGDKVRKSFSESEQFVALQVAITTLSAVPCLPSRVVLEVLLTPRCPAPTSALLRRRFPELRRLCNLPRPG